MRVYLVRHGQTAWNAERRYQGHTDIPLDERGLEQARLIAAAFEDRPISRILSSDLNRARATAEPLAKGMGILVETRRDLRERCIGDWEALPMEQVSRFFREAEIESGNSREEVRPPNGESKVDVWNRLEAVARDIEEFSDPQAVIVHGGSGSMLLSRLLRASVYTARSFRFDNGGITTISRRADGGFHLVGYNDAAHFLDTVLPSGGFGGSQVGPDEAP